ncbi:MAG TPA: hypothetical protein VF997_03505, partial [Polyangia bacterium]
MLLELVIVGGLGLAGAAAGLRRRFRARAAARLGGDAPATPDGRARAIAWLKQEVAAHELDSIPFGVQGGGRRRYGPLRDRRLALAEALVADDQPTPALEQLAHIAIPEPLADPPLEQPAWAWRMR